MVKKSEKILNKVKYIIGLDDYEEDIEEYEDEEIKHGISKSNKILNIHTNSNMKLIIHQPNKYEDAPKIVEDLKSRKTIVMNLDKIESDLKRQVFDFLNGAVYALEGNIQKVAKDIFIIAPNNVEINGKIKEELKNRGIFPWKK
ncbi:cell division protein SepF [Thermohalobacter berrensis]|uniref:Cell division protein SepF n=1 Tax=Thermohalobacter berrensis TaxID=99594 RepID=A0A419TA20_9FIRM|nr:cell division protein SepF [Thermohalobacter berrensis]RKD34329.1 cell division protein SepF [Thermohalobacter berrensis]